MRLIKYVFIKFSVDQKPGIFVVGGARDFNFAIDRLIVASASPEPSPRTTNHAL